MSDTMLNYCIQLSNAVREADRQVKEAWGITPEGGHDVTRTVGDGKGICDRRIRAKMGRSLSSLAANEVSSKSPGKITMDTCYFCKFVQCDDKVEPGE